MDIPEIASIQSEIDSELKRHDDRETDLLIHSLAALFGPSTHSNTDDEKQEENTRHHATMVLLLARKITAECRACTALFSRRKLKTALQADMPLFYQHVQPLIFQFTSPENAICNGLDLLAALAPDIEPVLKACCEDFVPLEARRPCKDISGAWFLFSATAKLLAGNGNTDEAALLLEALADNTRTDDSDARRLELLSETYGLLVDLSPQTICRIAQRESDYANGYSEDFYFHLGLTERLNQQYEQAREHLHRSYVIRCMLEGEDSWYAEIAQRELAVLELCQYAIDRLDFLNYFVDRILAHGYREPIDATVQQMCAAETIQFILMQQNEEIRDIARFQALLEYYGNACRNPASSDFPLICMRFYWNHCGTLALMQGDYTAAEAAFTTALDAPASEQTRDILSDAMIKSNVLLCLCVQNDYDTAAPLIDELLDAFDDAEDSVSNQETYYRVLTAMLGLTAQIDLPPDTDYADAIRDLLRETFDELRDEAAISDRLFRRKLIFFLQALQYCLMHDSLPEASLSDAFSFSKHVFDHAEDFQLTAVQRTSLGLVIAILAATLEVPDCDQVCQMLLQKSLNGPAQSALELSLLGSVGQILARHGHIEQGLQLTGTTLDGMEALWHQYAAYINDERLAAALEPMQASFSSFYAMLRREAPTECCYEALLRFKLLASLAGRERNRFLRSSSLHDEQLEELHRLQNEIAQAETAALYLGSSAALPEKRSRLRQLENQFTASLNGALHFTKISWEGTAAAIPDHSAVLEYCFCAADYGITHREMCEISDTEDRSAIDLYITTKQNGTVSLKRITIPEAAQIIEDALTYIELLQNPEGASDDSGQAFRLDDLRAALYEALILPALDTIEGFPTLYIAPDGLLVNLPFELLCRDLSERLIENHLIIKLECARDFLFFTQPGTSGSGSLVIGNPQYQRGRDSAPQQDTPENTSDDTRAVSLDNLSLPQLPYAELEAQRAAFRLHTHATTGISAVKGLVMHAQGVETLHLATHGLYDLDGESNALFSSALSFSGICDWAATGTVSPEYGNGMLTADEISRLDLHASKLVVLSACMSGMRQETFQRGSQSGLIGAFAAAGVKYVIAHMWAEPDSLGTVILLDAFYRYYAVEGDLPPVALSKAKDYLRRLSIREIREQGWFTYINGSSLPEPAREQLRCMEALHDRFRPFKDEMLWGGFVCYQCN